MARIRPVTSLRAGSASVAGSVYAEHTGSGALGSASSTLVGTGNVSSQGSDTWEAFEGPTFTEGQADTWSFAEYAPADALAFVLAAESAALPEGVTLDSDNAQLVYDGGGSAGETTGVIIESIADAEEDWQHRISGTGVVWYHDFRSDAEVDQFRWTPGFGNDPGAVGANSQAPFPGNTRRITSDGIPGAGSGVLEIFCHQQIPGNTGDTAEWWRPFSALKAPGNGRDTDDPAAGGTIALRTWNPSNGSTTTASWQNGYYGHEDYHTSNFDGTEYYIQVRVKIDPNRDASNNDAGGKLFYFTRTDKSLTDQEIVTESLDADTHQPFFSLYRSGSQPLENDSPGVNTHGNQPGIEGGLVGNGVCRFDNNGGRAANCWMWPLGSWVTIQYHVRPGHDGVPDTVIEVWIQEEPGGPIRKIWNQQNVPLIFDVRNGHNALIVSGYMNRFQGRVINTAFYHRCTQIIFSKEFIPFPQV